MSKREQIEDLEARITELETMFVILDEQVDLLTQDMEVEDEPDEFISESVLVHAAYASHAAYSFVDTQAFVTGYCARAKEEEGIYAP
jgi:hypothetical protein